MIFNNEITQLPEGLQTILQKMLFSITIRDLGIRTDNLAGVFHNHGELRFHNAPNRIIDMMLNARRRYNGSTYNNFSPVFIGVQGIPAEKEIKGFI